MLWSLITNSYTLLPPSSFGQIYIYICGQHDALYAIINSNYLLSILKAPLNIECHFLFIIPYMYIYWLSIAKLIICGQRDALHAIINSNYLLSILKAPLNIECHFLFIIHIYIYMCVCVCVCVCARNKFYVIHLFWVPQKQKPLLLPINPHLQLHFVQHFSSLFASLPPPLLSTSPLHFLHHFLFLIIWLFFFPFYFV